MNSLSPLTAGAVVDGLRDGVDTQESLAENAR
jgi:hypothetical protein